MHGAFVDHCVSKQELNLVDFRGLGAFQPAPQAGTVRVAAIQMASGPNVASNLAEAEQLIEEAELLRADGADGKGRRFHGAQPYCARRGG